MSSDGISFNDLMHAIELQNYLEEVHESIFARFRRRFRRRFRHR